MITDGMKYLSIGMITDFFMVTILKSDEWLLHFGTTVHVCYNCEIFKSYEEVDGWEVLIRNRNSAKVLSARTLHLHFTYGKKLSLVNVLHVLKVKSNLLSVSLLYKRGFKIV